MLARHAFSDVIVRHDERPRIAHFFVAAGVVAVPVGVEHKFDRLVTQQFERGKNLGIDRRILVVNDKQRIVPNRDTDVATGTEQHVGGRR